MLSSFGPPKRLLFEKSFVELHTVQYSSRLVSPHIHQTALLQL